MGERSLLLRALLEHRDRQTNALLNVHHENFFLVAKKNRAAAARRSEAADLHFDNGLTHTASLVIPFHRSKGTRVRRPNLHPRMKLPTFGAISCGKSRLERLFFSLVESILFPLT